MMHFNSEHIFNLHKTLQSIFNDSYPLFLICLDYHNKIPQTDWLEQRELIFSLFWKLQKSGAGCQQGWYLNKALMNCRWRTIHCVLTWTFLPTQAAWCLFLQRTLIPSDQGPLLWPHLMSVTSLEAPFWIQPHWGLRFYHMNFGGILVNGTHLFTIFGAHHVCLFIFFTFLCFIWDNFPCA
jgi:hypothetical protein